MAELSIEDITSNGTVVLDGTKYKWTGDGVLDKLLEVVNANIKMQWDNGGITSKNFAEVYIGIIPTVLAQATQYALQEKKIETEITNMNNITKAELEKQWGYETSYDITSGNLGTGLSTGLGKIDAEIKNIDRRSI